MNIEWLFPKSFSKMCPVVDDIIQNKNLIGHLQQPAVKMFIWGSKVFPAWMRRMVQVRLGLCEKRSARMSFFSTAQLGSERLSDGSAGRFYSGHTSWKWQSWSLTCNRPVDGGYQSVSVSNAHNGCTLTHSSCHGPTEQRGRQRFIQLSGSSPHILGHLQRKNLFFLITNVWKCIQHKSTRQWVGVGGKVNLKDRSDPLQNILLQQRLLKEWTCRRNGCRKLKSPATLFLKHFMKPLAALNWPSLQRRDKSVPLRVLWKS